MSSLVFIVNHLMSKDTNLWSKYFPFFSLQLTIEAAFTMLPNVPAIPAVADYGLLNYPPIRKITRSRKPETCTAPAIVRYSMLAFRWFSFHLLMLLFLKLSSKMHPSSFLKFIFTKKPQSKNILFKTRFELFHES